MASLPYLSSNRGRSPRPLVTPGASTWRDSGLFTQPLPITPPSSRPASVCGLRGPMAPPRLGAVSPRSNSPGSWEPRVRSYVEMGPLVEQLGAASRRQGRPTTVSVEMLTWTGDEDVIRSAPFSTDELDPPVSSQIDGASDEAGPSQQMLGSPISLTGPAPNLHEEDPQTTEAAAPSVEEASYTESQPSVSSDASSSSTPPDSPAHLALDPNKIQLIEPLQSASLCEPLFLPEERIDSRTSVRSGDNPILLRGSGGDEDAALPSLAAPNTGLKPRTRPRQRHGKPRGAAHDRMGGIQSISSIKDISRWAPPGSPSSLFPDVPFREVPASPPLSPGRLPPDMVKRMGASPRDNLAIKPIARRASALPEGVGRREAQNELGSSPTKQRVKSVMGDLVPEQRPERFLRPATAPSAPPIKFEAAAKRAAGKEDRDVPFGTPYCTAATPAFEVPSGDELRLERTPIPSPVLHASADPETPPYEPLYSLPKLQTAVRVITAPASPPASPPLSLQKPGRLTPDSRAQYWRDEADRCMDKVRATSRQASPTSDEVLSAASSFLGRNFGHSGSTCSARPGSSPALDMPPQARVRLSTHDSESETPDLAQYETFAYHETLRNLTGTGTPVLRSNRCEHAIDVRSRNEALLNEAECSKPERWLDQTAQSPLMPFAQHGMEFDTRLLVVANPYTPECGNAPSRDIAAQEMSYEPAQAGFSNRQSPAAESNDAATSSSPSKSPRRRSTVRLSNGFATISRSIRRAFSFQNLPTRRSSILGDLTSSGETPALPDGATSSNASASASPAFVLHQYGNGRDDAPRLPQFEPLSGSPLLDPRIGLPAGTGASSPLIDHWPDYGYGHGHGCGHGQPHTPRSRTLTTPNLSAAATASNSSGCPSSASSFVLANANASANANATSAAMLLASSVDADVRLRGEAVSRTRSAFSYAYDPETAKSSTGALDSFSVRALGYEGQTQSQSLRTPRTPRQDRTLLPSSPSQSPESDQSRRGRHDGQDLKMDVYQYQHQYQYQEQEQEHPWTRSAPKTMMTVSTPPMQSTKWDLMWSEGGNGNGDLAEKRGPVRLPPSPLPHTPRVHPTTPKPMPLTPNPSKDSSSNINRLRSKTSMSSLGNFWIAHSPRLSGRLRRG